MSKDFCDITKTDMAAILIDHIEHDPEWNNTPIIIRSYILNLKLALLSDDKPSRCIAAVLYDNYKGRHPEQITSDDLPF